MAIEEWLKIYEVEQSTREGYEMYLRLHIGPALGDEPAGKKSARVLEQFYAELRGCSARCDGTPRLDHRVEGSHGCRTVCHRRPPLRIRAYEREKAWEPRCVANELAGTRQAAEQHCQTGSHVPRPGFRADLHPCQPPADSNDTSRVPVISLGKLALGGASGRELTTWHMQIPCGSVGDVARGELHTSDGDTFRRQTEHPIYRGS
jgi:hypothetical protein